MLPVSHQDEGSRVQLGYGYLKIGGEPQFVLDEYDPQTELVTTAKRLAAKGSRGAGSKSEGSLAREKSRAR